MRKIDVVCGIMILDGKVLLAQNPPGHRHAGQWEFPGGKVEPKESNQAAIIRELEEELGIGVVEVQVLNFAIEQIYPDITVRLIPCVVPTWEGTPTAITHSTLTWAAWKQVEQLELAAGDRAIWRKFQLSLPKPYDL